MNLRGSSFFFCVFITCLTIGLVSVPSQIWVYGQNELLPWQHGVSRIEEADASMRSGLVDLEHEWRLMVFTVSGREVVKTSGNIDCINTVPFGSEIPNIICAEREHESSRFRFSGQQSEALGSSWPASVTSHIVAKLFPVGDEVFEPFGSGARIYLPINPHVDSWKLARVFDLKFDCEPSRWADQRDSADRYSIKDGHPWTFYSLAQSQLLRINVALTFCDIRLTSADIVLRFHNCGLSVENPKLQCADHRQDNKCRYFECAAPIDLTDYITLRGIMCGVVAFCSTWFFAFVAHRKKLTSLAVMLVILSGPLCVITILVALYFSSEDAPASFGSYCVSAPPYRRAVAPSQACSTATISDTSQSLEVTLAAIAGVTFRV